MIEVAVLEVQERIKKVDAAFTWPHPIDKGYFVSAIFVRTDEDKPFLIYCPRTTAAISIDEETPFPFFSKEPLYEARKVMLNQNLTSAGNICFYLIYLGKVESKQIQKREIEKMFGIKVVD